MKSFEQIQLDIKYEESIASLRRYFELSVNRLVNSRLRVAEQLDRIACFEKLLDDLLQKGK